MEFFTRIFSCNFMILDKLTGLQTDKDLEASEVNF